jgi:hypothetical protein
MSDEIVTPEVQKQIDAAIAGLKAKNSELIGSLKAAKESLAKFDGIDVEAIRSRKLIDASEVEIAKTEITKAFQAQLDQANTKAQSLEQALYAEKVGGSFSRSKLIAEKLAIPADMVRSHFGQSFKVEAGQMIAYDTNGEKIYSKANPGELAGFDEALGVLIDAYPHKDHILKSSGASGSGAHGGNHVPTASNSVRRAQWDSMDTNTRMTFIKSGGKVTD